VHGVQWPGYHGGSAVSVIVGHLLQGYIVTVSTIGGYRIPGIQIERFPGSIVSLHIA
jgi:hypothetical protein